MAYWLFKTEPETYSFAQLKKDGVTPWNGVRNFQARNFLRETKPGDSVLIYHSGDERAVVGLAKVKSAPYPDTEAKGPKGEWVQIDVAYAGPIKNPVSLSAIKASAKLRNLLLVRHSRLSCMPLKAEEYQEILKMSGSTEK